MTPFNHTHITNSTHKIKPLYSLLPELKELIISKDWKTLSEALKSVSPLDLAESWDRLDPDEQLALFRLFSPSRALKLFESISVDEQRFLFLTLADEEMLPVLQEMHTPDVAKFFRKLPPKIIKRMQHFIKENGALKQVSLLMNFPENSAGRLMHPEFVKLEPVLTARKALARLQAISTPRQKEHLYGIYVTGDDGKLLGALNLHDLVSAPEDAKLSETMRPAEPIKVRANLHQEEAAKIFMEHNLLSAPVVDEENRLIGILLVDDIIEVIKKEATEDITKMAGTRAEDLQARSVFKVVRLRLPWLVTTLCGELLVSVVIRFFHATLSQVIALASFLPLIAAMGGNVGSQSATVVVRGLATGEIPVKNLFRTVFRELRVGLTLGSIYGVVLGTLVFILFGKQLGLSFSIALAAGMLTSMVVAATVGAFVPFFFVKIGVDPATATGPLITTTTDLISTTAYLALATTLLIT